ncbi:hypothetical protein GBA52_014881, partial [Prunus armeniaca]
MSPSTCSLSSLLSLPSQFLSFQTSFLYFSLSFSASISLLLLLISLSLSLFPFPITIQKSRPKSPIYYSHLISLSFSSSLCPSLFVVVEEK